MGEGGCTGGVGGVCSYTVTIKLCCNTVDRDIGPVTGLITPPSRVCPKPTADKQMHIK